MLNCAPTFFTEVRISQSRNILGSVYINNRLDGCIVWNAHNTEFGSKRSVSVCYLFISCIRRGLVSRDSTVDRHRLPRVTDVSIIYLASTSVRGRREFGEVSYLYGLRSVQASQNLPGPAPDNVLRVLQISSRSVHLRRNYVRTREHRQSALESRSNIRLKPIASRRAMVDCFDVQRFWRRLDWSGQVLSMEHGPKSI